MRLLFVGDIVGRAGRDAIVAHLPDLKRAAAIDFVVANGENAASGFGITEKICQALFQAFGAVGQNGTDAGLKTVIMMMPLGCSRRPSAKRQSAQIMHNGLEDAGLQPPHVC